MNNQKNQVYYEISHAEKRMFYLQKFYKDTTMCNIPHTVLFDKPVDFPLLNRAINIFIKNNQNLRIRFCEINDEPKQYFSDFSETNFEIINFSAAEAMEKWAAAKSLETFGDLYEKDLYKIVLINLADKRGGFFVNFHHIIFDGMSFALFTDKIYEYYGKLLNNENIPEENFTLYSEYLKDENAYLNSKSAQDDLKYWKNVFSTDVEQLELKPGADNMSIDIKRNYHRVSNELNDKIYKYCSKNNISVYNLFLACLYAYYNRLTQKEDIVISTTHHNRSEDFKKTTGMFISTLPLRLKFSPDITFKELLTLYLNEFDEMMKHQKYPTDMLISELRNEKRDIENVFNIMATAYIKSDNSKINVKSYANSNSVSAVTYFISYNNKEKLPVELMIDYKTSIYNENEASLMAGHIFNILNAVTGDDNIKINKIDFLTDSEKRRLINEFNDTAAYYPADKTFIDIFDEQVIKTPNKKAVVYLDKSYTYLELYNRAEKLAHKLRGLGIKRDDIVSIFVDRSLEMFVAAVGVLKAGGAFMPIDTKYPADRIEFMLADSQSRVFLTQKHLIEKAKFDGTIIDLDDQSLYSADCPKINNVNKPQDLAYIIYTSGSTGKPKGTMIEHGSLLNFSFWSKNFHNLTENDNTAKHASFGFDASIVEVFPPLIAGCEIHIISEDIKLSLVELNEYFEKNKIRYAFLTTQLAEQFMENIDNKSLRWLDTGGEKLRTFKKRDYQLVNVYGPTECTVYTTAFQVNKNYENIPIGKPLSNAKIFITDRFGNLMPEGYCGELCVAGVCLSRGYLNRPETTAEKFIECPFSPKERMYKTGDLVRWLPNGDIEYIGRIDNQVKLRGFRIELGEIEQEIMKIDGIKTSAVTVISEGDNKLLCAYIVSESKMSDDGIKNTLAATLPEFMIPSYIVRLETMPVNASGKIDRKALPAPNIKIETQSTYVAAEGEIETRLLKMWKETLGIENFGVCDNFFKIGGHSLKAVMLQAKIERDFGVRVPVRKIFEAATIRLQAELIKAEKSGTSNIDLGRLAAEQSSGKKVIERGVASVYIEPATNTEKALIKIWEELLNVDGVGTGDNFFSIGGHSIKAVTMQYKIEKEFKARIPVKDIFKAPTIRELAVLIDGAEKVSSIETSVSLGDKNYYPSSSVQKRLFMIEQKDGSSTTYNIPMAMRIKGRLDDSRLSDSIEKMIERHEALRTSFAMIDGEPMIKINKDVKLKKIYQKAEESELGDIMKDFLKPFDLTKAPLFRIKLVKISDENHVLLIDFHHIIFDGMSLEIFMKELFEIYSGQTLPALEYQYKDFVAWQQKYLKSNKMIEQEKAWLEMLSGELPVLNMPTDHARTAEPGLAGAQYDFFIEHELSSKLKNYANKTQSTLYMVFLSALNIMLSKYCSQEDIIVGSPLLGRPTIESQQMLGMFVNTMPVRNYPKPDKKANEFIDEVKRNFFNVIDNQDYQLDTLIEKLNIKRESSRNPLFDVIFVFQTSQGIKDTRYGDIMVSPGTIETGTAKFDLSLQAYESGDYIKCMLEYRCSLFEPDTIKRMSMHLSNILEQIADNPEIALKDIELITDSEKKTVLYEFNMNDMDYPKDKTVHELFEANAELYPDRGAVVYKDKKYTYRELNERANMLARCLVKNGVKPRGFVALISEKSAEVALGALAIQKAGACYVPIDPSYPQDRIEYMLGDTASNVVLCQKELIDKVPFNGVKINIDDESIYSGTSDERKNLDIKVNSEDLSYLIYTSGSTGKPKGVMIEHRSIINLCCWEINKYKLTHEDKITQYVSICFDPSVGCEMFLSLLTGAELHVVAPELRMDPVKLNEYMEKNKVTFTILPTQFYEQFSELTDNKSLRYLMVGGEKLKAYKKANYKLINAYGPTEYTVITTAFNVEKDYENIPIGSGIANSRLYVLDKYNKLMPVGIYGELCISGDGLARGYLNRPELNSEKFPADPFLEGKRMYRTGDLVRWLPDGNIEFNGRIDFQVKIRGFRIEIGEIEAQMQKHEQIEAVLVLAKEDESKNKYLCAFYSSNEEIPNSDLKAFLAKSLANYMIPSFFVWVKDMPINSSGKIDRKALEKLEIKKPIEVKVDPQNEKEEKIARVWREVLNIQKIGINENFFEIGGHSLKAVAAVAKMQNDFDVTINDIFKYQTIFALAANLKDKKGSLSGKLAEIKEKSAEISKKSAEFMESKWYLDFVKQYQEKNKKYEKIDIHKRKSYKAVLLTGATGYLGVYLLHDLLKYYKCDIYVPVRGKTDGDSLRRLNEKYRYYFNSELTAAQLERVKVICCSELQDENLGINKAIYDKLVDTVDCVINPAANVKHYGRYEEFYAPNVGAVANLVKFAASGIKKDLHHVSTASVASGYIEGTDFSAFCEDTCNVGQKSDNLYIITKLMAEELVIKARAEFGINTNIYRVGNISFNSETGHLQQNVEENAFSTMVKSFVNLGVVPQSDDMAELSFVDKTSAAILVLFDKANLLNETYHIHNSKPVKLSDILTSKKLSLSVEAVPLETFIDRLGELDKKECFRQHVQNFMLHRGWLSESGPETQFALHSERTFMLLKMLGFEWPELDEMKLIQLITMSLKDRIKFIMDSELFNNIPYTVQRELAFISRELAVDENDTLIWEDNECENMYMIVDGVAEIQKSSKSGWVGTIMVASAGDVIGLEALLDKKSGTTAEAIMGDLTILAFDKKKINSILKTAPELCYNLFKFSNAQSGRMAGMIANFA